MIPARKTWDLGTDEMDRCRIGAVCAGVRFSSPEVLDEFLAGETGLQYDTVRVPLLRKKHYLHPGTSLDSSATVEFSLHPFTAQQIIHRSDAFQEGFQEYIESRMERSLREEILKGLEISYA